MDNPAFARLRELLEVRTSNTEWSVCPSLYCALVLKKETRFGMAEHAINTIYVLGDQPDALCSDILRDMSRKLFSTPQARDAIQRARDQSEAPTGDAMMEDKDEGDEGTEQQINATVLDGHDDEDMAIPPTPSSSHTPFAASQHPGPSIPSFKVDHAQLAQLIFLAGHCAIKQLIHLELVEREHKRKKAEQQKAQAASAPKGANQDELDQVVGSVEDEIADVMHETRERELLYGQHALFRVLSGMAVSICRFNKTYTVSSSQRREYSSCLAF